MEHCHNGMMTELIGKMSVQQQVKKPRLLPLFSHRSLNTMQKKVAFLAHNRWCPDPENHHMFAIFLAQKPLMIALVVGEGV